MLFCCVFNSLGKVVLLGLKYTEMSWDFAKPLRDNDPDCLPCLFLQFAVSEGGMRVSKMLQVFSRQVLCSSLKSRF